MGAADPARAPTMTTPHDTYLLTTFGDSRQFAAWLRAVLPRRPPDLVASWLRYQPHLTLVVDDLAKRSESELQRRRLRPAGILAQLAMRTLTGCDPPQALAALRRWGPLLAAVAAEDEHCGSEHLSAFFWYLLHVTETDPRDAQMAIQQHLPHPRGSFMSTAEKLRSEGLAQGLAQGQALGLVAGRAATLGRLLTRRFGPLPSEVETRLQAATLAELDSWTDRILDAGSLREVFRAQ
ncbi:MAG: DUF4351 domain-containing protein [Planctomycetes bacterium]|nr:DUF4351 domain-containing protein [Planctomycetota bacterium]